MLQAEGCWNNLQGQANHQVTLGAFKCPTVTWIHIRLERKVFTEYETQLHYEGGFYNGEAHLDNNTWRL